MGWFLTPPVRKYENWWKFYARWKNSFSAFFTIPNSKSVEFLYLNVFELQFMIQKVITKDFDKKKNKKLQKQYFFSSTKLKGAFEITD